MSNQPNPNVFFRGEDMGIGNFPIKGGTINDGGPAFPMGYHPEGNNADHFGMSIRDYFAAAALQGLMSKLDPEEHWADYRAKWSYEAADALLKAREAK
jgi:hypothetical protein